MLETATVSFDISDHLGNDFDPRRTKVWVTTNVPGNTIIDTEGDQIRLGSGTTAVAADGTGSLSVWVPDESANPASWQTSIHVDYPDRAANSGRTAKSFGPFTIGPNVKVTNKALTSNVATLTTGTAHGLLAGDKVTVLDVAAPFAGTWTVATAPTTTTFTFAVTNANVTSAATTGRLATSLADLVTEMPVQPEYAMQFLNRIDGVQDHGNVSGAVSIDPAISTHWLDATAATVLTLEDGPAGGTRYVTALVISGAEDVSIDGLDDAVLVDGAFATFAWVRDAWLLAAAGGSGGEPPVADTTPPSSVTGLSATGGEGQITFNWTAATDAESPVKYGYRVWLTSGGATGSYTTRTTVGPVTVTGLAAGAYTVQVYSFSNGGNTTAVSATATVTVNPFPGAEAYDTFTRSGNLWGSVTEGGSLTWGNAGISGLIGATGDMTITSGKVAGSAGSGGGTVNLGQTTASIEADYVISGGRATVMVAGSSDGATSLIARVFPAGEGLKIYRDGGTQIGSTVASGIPDSGRIKLSYNATTGAIAVTIDGVSKFTDTHAGLTGTRSGVESTLSTTLDNVVWDLS